MRTSAAALLLLLSCGHPPAETVNLTPGAVHPRTLTGRGPYLFQFQLPADRFLRLDIEQRGVDVVVLLRDPAGRLLYEVDSPNGTERAEPVLAVTPVSGEHLLIVEPLHPEARGDFALVVREVRPATQGDRVRAAAATAFARAERRRLEGDLDRAGIDYRKALPLLEACGERRQAAEAQWHLGEALLEAAELRQAAAVLEQAAARFRALGDRPGEAHALNDLGAAWRLLGDPEPALAAYQRALHLFRAAGLRRDEASTLNNIGLLFKGTGDLQGALNHFEAALALWRPLQAKSSEAATLENLGSLHTLIGQDDEALGFLQEALRLRAGEKDLRKRASVLIELGWSQYWAGHPELALDHYRDAIALAERAGDRLRQAGAWDRRGSALRALHRYDEAAASYARALAMSRAAGSRLHEGHILANLGELDLETGAVERGRQRLQRAADFLTASGDPNAVISARVSLGRAERRLGRFGPARKQAETAIRLVESLRTGLRGPMSRGNFLATRIGAYEELATLLMQLDRTREALEVAERARARNLLEDIREENRECVESASRARETLTPDPSPNRTPDLRERGAPTQKPFPQFRFPPLPVARECGWERGARGVRALTANEIQALADDGTLLVVYLLAEPASFAWTVHRKTVASHTLAGRERIEKLARRVIHAMPHSHEVAGQGTATRAAQELADAILAPLGERLAGRQRLVILADGALHLVPFAALPGSTGEPLLADHEIVMVPSATVLQAQRRRFAGRPPAPELAAILADPIFSPTDERLQFPLSRGKGGRWERGPGGEGPALERLPYTATEAEDIVRLIPRGQALLALGPAASRDLVLAGGLRRYRILHFATHGLLHPVLPERSGIVLSLFDEKGKRLDGFLSAPDVAALDLPAETVVLSACQTGLGREMRGEGLVGLTHAFFRAGARRVVVSTWKVRDRATAELMARFYRHLLGDGLPPAAALRAAQLSIRNEPQWHAPYFWAGFSLQGDWQ